MFTMAELNILCETYGIGRPMLTNSLLKSEAHAGFTLLTTEGHFVLVPIDPERSLVAVGYEHQLVRYLVQQDFPVSEPFTTRYGTKVALLSGKLYVLFANAHYSSYNPRNPQHLPQAARVLASLHQLLEVYPLELVPSDQLHMLDTFGESARTMLAQLERSCTHHFRRASLLQRSFELLRGQICQLESDLSYRSSFDLPQGLIHTHYTPAQLLFDGDELKTVSSFAELSYAPRLYDLVYAMVHFAQVHARSQPQPSCDIQVMRDFLSHYCIGQQLTVSEFVELPIVLRPMWLLVGLENALRDAHFLSVQQLLAHLRQLLASLERLELYNDPIFEELVLEVGV